MPRPRPLQNQVLLIASLLLALGLAGCGWQLRGAPAFDGMETLTLDGGSRVLRHRLERELEAAGVLVHEQSPWRLGIQDESWQRRTIAVDDRGRAAEIALHLSLQWQLFDNDSGEPAAPQRRLHIERTYHYNPDSAVSSSDEEEMLREALYQDAVWQLMRQLEATASRLPAASGEKRESET